MRRTLLVLAVAIPLLVLAERAATTAAARRLLPTGGAEWIWAPWALDSTAPAVFYAARDVTLDPVPAGLRLLVLADEEYVLYVNGRRAGANRYRSGAPLDVYPAAELLQPGANRILVELRSARGAGGFLACLEAPGGRRLLGTDRRWQVFRRHHPGLVAGWLALDGGEPALPAFSWGLPPVGRWEVPRPGPELEPLDELTGRPLRAQAVAGDARGARKVLDWGREVTGYLRLEHRPGQETGVALLFTGRDLPDTRQGRSETAVLLMPGRRSWLDARPRRFRYAVVLGGEAVTGGRLLPLPAGAAARAALGEGKPEGAFGLDAPPLRTPVEDEVRRELKGVAGVAGREEL
jgi:hypothetical protein